MAGTRFRRVCLGTFPAGIFVLHRATSFVRTETTWPSRCFFQGRTWVKQSDVVSGTLVFEALLKRIGFSNHVWLGPRVSLWPCHGRLGNAPFADDVADQRWPEHTFLFNGKELACAILAHAFTDAQAKETTKSS